MTALNVNVNVNVNVNMKRVTCDFNFVRKLHSMLETTTNARAMHEWCTGGSRAGFTPHSRAVHGVFTVVKTGHVHGLVHGLFTDFVTGCSRPIFHSTSHCSRVSHGRGDPPFLVVDGTAATSRFTLLGTKAWP